MKLGRWVAYLAFLLPLGALPMHAQYYRVEQRSGVWWFVAPSGKLMLSQGVDDISYLGDVIRGTQTHPYHKNVVETYPGEAAWESAVIKRLGLWGFNTLGAWTGEDLWHHGVAYTVILNIAERAGANWQYGRPADVFDPKFEETARAIARQICRPRAHDPQLIGYFSDNELRWGPDWRGRENMLGMYLNLPASAPGRKQAIEFLKRRYSGSIEALDQAWGVKAASFDTVSSVAAGTAFDADNLQFLGEVAQRYFETCARAIHAADPNHLYLGARFAGNPPDPLFRAARAADVVSINVYRFDPRPLVERAYALAGRPVLVTEFAFRAEDSGLPNTQGAGPKVPDETARARAYRDYVTDLESLPEAVGYHWFKWSDEPKQGRFDGENSNYGLVNIEDRPYKGFVRSVTQANHEAVAVHRRLMVK